MWVRGVCVLRAVRRKLVGWVLAAAAAGSFHVLPTVAARPAAGAQRAGQAALTPHSPCVLTTCVLTHIFPPPSRCTTRCWFSTWRASWPKTPSSMCINHVCLNPHPPSPPPVAARPAAGAQCGERAAWRRGGHCTPCGDLPAHGAPRGPTAGPGGAGAAGAAAGAAAGGGAAAAAVRGSVRTAPPSSSSSSSSRRRFSRS